MNDKTRLFLVTDDIKTRGVQLIFAEDEAEAAKQYVRAGSELIITDVGEVHKVTAMLFSPASKKGIKT